VIGPPVLPRVGEVLVLAAGEWSHMGTRRRVVPADRPVRLRVSKVDTVGVWSYAGEKVWVAGAELDEDGQPVRCWFALVPTRSARGGVGQGEQR
jgi:hypothetical protein